MTENMKWREVGLTLGIDQVVAAARARTAYEQKFLEWERHMNSQQPAGASGRAGGSGPPQSSSAPLPPSYQRPPSSYRGGATASSSGPAGGGTTHSVAPPAPAAAPHLKLAPMQKGAWIDLEHLKLLSQKRGQQ